MPRKSRSRNEFMRAAKWTKGRVPNPIPARGIFVNPSTPRDVNAFTEPSKAPAHLIAAYSRWGNYYEEEGDTKRAKKAKSISRKAKALAKEIKTMEELQNRNDNPHYGDDEHMRMANPRRRKRRKRKDRTPKTQQASKSKSKKKGRKGRRTKNPVAGYVKLKRTNNPGNMLSGLAMKFSTILVSYMVPGIIDGLAGKWLAETDLYKKSENPRAWAGATIGAGAMIFGGALTSYIKPLKPYREDAVSGMMLYTLQNIIAGFVSKGEGSGYEFMRSALNLKQPDTYSLISQTMPKILLVINDNGVLRDKALNEITPRVLPDRTLVDSKTNRILVDVKTGQRLIKPSDPATNTGKKTTAGYATLVPTSSGSVSGYVNIVDPSIPAETPPYLLYQGVVNANNPYQGVVNANNPYQKPVNGYARNPMSSVGRGNIFRNSNSR